MAGEWWRGRLVGFDLETTSADPEDARIVTAAVATCGGGLATETATWLADPGIEIPEEAAAIHGVSTERARAEGLEASHVVDVVVALLARAAGSWSLPLVIFNAPYDLTVLDREARRHGVVPLTERGLTLCTVDPLVIDKHIDRYRKGSRTLDAICEHYGASLDGAHDAAHDAIAAARLAFVICARGEMVRKVWNAQMGREKAALTRVWLRARDDLAMLHALQAELAREQALGLAEHFREQGKLDEAAGVRTEWPVVPVATTKGAA